MKHLLFLMSFTLSVTAFAGISGQEIDAETAKYVNEVVKEVALEQGFEIMPDTVQVPERGNNLNRVRSVFYAAGTLGERQHTRRAIFIAKNIKTQKFKIGTVVVNFYAADDKFSPPIKFARTLKAFNLKIGVLQQDDGSINLSFEYPKLISKNKIFYPFD